MNGDYLKKMRKQAGLTKTALAFDLGVHDNSIIQWEMDKHQIPKLVQTSLRLYFKEKCGAHKNKRKISGKDLRNTRLRLKLKQREMAVEIGVTQAAISMWERGKSRISSLAQVTLILYFQNKGV